MIVHLNGRPGVGKHTIGTLVSRELDARYIHNHLLHDVAITCCGMDGPERWVLYERVRSAAHDTLRARPPGERPVMTNALCRNAPASHPVPVRSGLATIPVPPACRRRP